MTPLLSPLSKETIQETIIGTKWIAAGENLHNRDTIDFADNTYCIYTSLNRSKTFTYRIKENRIIIGDIAAFIIKGNSLCLGEYPYFIRAA